MKSKGFNLSMLLVFAAGSLAVGQELTRAEKLQRDRERVEEKGVWIYNDLAKGFVQARESGKPLMVVLRCVPCEECVKLDDELVDTDPSIGPLLKEFVCVRQVATNGLDLSIFQYDTDQSFAVFFLNGDGTVYGRFGTRSHQTEWQGDVSLAGMAKAMGAALAIHKGYPGNQRLLAGKQGGKPDVDSPELYPSLRDQYTSRLKSGGELVKSCIHCHQIGDAQREYYWNREETFPEDVLFPYPHPKIVGLVLDAEEMATVKDVLPGSVAEQAGLQAGDQITHLNQQPVISMADVQWVLHNMKSDGGEVTIQGLRSGNAFTSKLELESGWRSKDDLSWRASSWGLRRMVTGGMVLEAVDNNQRKQLGLKEGQMGLRARHVGQYGAHAAAKNQGFKVDDVIVSYDGQDDLVRESDLIAYGVRHHRAGDKVDVEIMRAGKRMKMSLPIQP